MVSREEALRRAAQERMAREAARRSHDAAALLQRTFRGHRARRAWHAANLAQLERLLHDYFRVADIVAAVHWMQSTIGMPALLVGHSLGGTAAIAAAARLDGIRAVCTLGAPATADHVLRHFGPTKSEEDGQIQVDLGVVFERVERMHH